MAVKILWIEGKRAESPSFVPNLRRKGYLVDIVNTGTAAISHIQRQRPDLVVLDSASMRTSGIRVCQSLRQLDNSLPIIVITLSNRTFPEESGANVVLHLPFTSRKLLNRIVPLLPGEGDKLIERGPVRLDVKRRKLHSLDREVQLTPRLTLLMQTLMEHSGEVLKREQLFRQVWDTKYTGDTRTLDVHISWLRRALEENPRKPQFLITIRGIGYRLDVENT